MSVINNPWQGHYPRVLFVCSAGILRSATAAHHFAAKYEWNTRNAGTEEYALIPLTEALCHWADRIYCMGQEHVAKVAAIAPYRTIGKDVVCLDIPDNFEYRSPELIKLLDAKVDNVDADTTPALAA